MFGAGCARAMRTRLYLLLPWLFEVGGDVEVGCLGLDLVAGGDLKEAGVGLSASQVNEANDTVARLLIEGC